MIDTRTRPIAMVLAPDGALWRAALVVAGTAVLALSARAAIPLPFSPVPVTGQTLAVLLIGAVYGARLGASTVAVYLFEGIAGLPVYAGGAAGPAQLVGPTGGYLVGFVAAAAFVGWAAERGWTRTILTTVLAMLGGEALMYAFGLAWLSHFALPVGLLDAGLIPFVPGDLYKLVLAIAAVPPVTRATARAHHATER